MQSDYSEPSEDQIDDENIASSAADFDQALSDAVLQAQNSSSETVDERVLAADREVLRARAEMENFRKRMQRDAEQQLKYANISLIRDLLEVVDNLQRAASAAQGQDASTQSLREGVEMVNQQFVSVLGKHSCKPIESVGTPFDPHFHEAISQMPSDEFEAGTVMQEVAVGYVLHDRVVRPSNVIVSTGAANT